MATTNPSSPAAVFPSLRRKSTSKATETEARQKRDAAVREAKQYVQSVIRADWAFDPPPTLWSSSSYSTSQNPTIMTAITAETSADANTQSGTEVRADIVEWRLREPASSESELEYDPAWKGDPYRFENPDAVKFNVLDRGRRRRADLEQEMKWNAGLRFFMERRDAWTGCKKRRNLQQRQARRGRTIAGFTLKGHKNKASLGSSKEDASLPDVETKLDSSEEASPSAHLPRDFLEDLTLSEEKSRDTTTTTTTDGKTDSNNSCRLDGPDDRHDYDDGYNCDSDDSMIPVMGSFIPDSNSIRSSITPAIYTSLYSKVIVQGLTPRIPINLSDVTKALVAGWKADGQWPPKPTIPPPGSDVPVRKKGNKASSTAKNDEVIANGIVSQQSSTTTTSGRKLSFSNQASTAVKKVLSLSNSFHLRRSSRSSATGETTEGMTPGSNRTSAADGAVADMPVEEETRYPFGLYG